MAEQRDKFLTNKAVQLLAQRDHSIFELKQKLAIFLSKQNHKNTANTAALQPDEQQNYAQKIEPIIQYCLEYNWLDDTNYTHKYIDMRSRKGYGGYKIIMELKQRGISPELSSSILNSKEIDWLYSAHKQMQKKFPIIDKQDIRQKAKIFQFLISRGFSQEEIKQAYALF